jgi:hypothetical protein
MASRNFGNVKAAAVKRESDQKKASPRKAGRAARSRRLLSPPLPAIILWPPDATMAATNKCLAKSNKSRTGDKAIVRIEARAVPYDIGRKAYRVMEKMVS